MHNIRFRRINKQIGKIFSSEIYDYHLKYTPDPEHDTGIIHTLFYPVHTPCTTILANIGRNGCPHRNSHHAYHILNLSCRRESCHISGTINIHRTLNYDSSDRCNRKLKSHRDSKDQQFTHAAFPKLKIFLFQMEDRIFFLNIDQAAYRRHTLCNDSRICTSFYSHSYKADQNNIKNNINSCRDDKKI